MCLLQRLGFRANNAGASDTHASFSHRAIKIKVNPYKIALRGQTTGLTTPNPNKPNAPDYPDSATYIYTNSRIMAVESVAETERERENEKIKVRVTIGLYDRQSASLRDIYA